MNGQGLQNVTIDLNRMTKPAGGGVVAIRCPSCRTTEIFWSPFARGLVSFEMTCWMHYYRSAFKLPLIGIIEAPKTPFLRTDVWR